MGEGGIERVESGKVKVERELNGCHHATGVTPRNDKRLFFAL
jgi:hypothetical protein